MAFLFDPLYQAVDANGLPLAGATLTFYRASTTAPITIYQNSSATTPHPNPLTADAAGMFAPIYLTTSQNYKIVLKDGDGVTVQTVDGILPGGQVDDGMIARPKLDAALSIAIPRDLSEFDAVGDGVTDDSAAVAAWLASSSYLTVGPGTYLTGKVTVPSTVKSISARGLVLFKPIAGTWTSSNFDNEWDKDITYAIGDSIQYITTAETVSAGLSPTGLMYRCLTSNINTPPDPNPAGASNGNWAYVPYDDFWLFNGCDDLRVDGLGFEVNSENYPHVRTVNFAGCDRLRAKDLYVPQGGGIGIYLGNCTDAIVQSPIVLKFAWLGITAAGASQDGVLIRSPISRTTTFGTGNCVSFQLGENCQATDCDVSGSRTFGVSAYNVTGVTLTGRSSNTKREGFNVIGCRDFTIDGDVFYDGAASDDFGCSIDGTAGISCQNGYVRISVANSYASGVCLTGDVVDTTVIANVKNSNLSMTANEGGVLLAGTNCQRNTVYAASIVDTTSTYHKYGVVEANLGGTPSNNTIHVGRITGFTVADVLRGGPTTRIFGMPRRTFTTTVTAASGTITSATGTIEWSYDGVFVTVDRLDLTITTNGTGAGEVRATLPLAAVSEGGFVSGKEVAVSGKGVTGEISTGFIILRFYDNTYPGANGARIVASGRYRPSV